MIILAIILLIHEGQFQMRLPVVQQFVAAEERVRGTPAATEQREGLGVLQAERERADRVDRAAPDQVQPEEGRDEVESHQDGQRAHPEAHHRNQQPETQEDSDAQPLPQRLRNDESQADKEGVRPEEYREGKREDPPAPLLSPTPPQPSRVHRRLQQAHLL